MLTKQHRRSISPLDASHTSAKSQSPAVLYPNSTCTVHLAGAVVRPLRWSESLGKEGFVLLVNSAHKLQCCASNSFCTLHMQLAAAAAMLLFPAG